MPGPIAGDSQNFPPNGTLLQLIDRPPEGSDSTSFSQLVQELIGGAVRRHMFTESELELLLDLQTSCIRKSARADVLRRYLKAVQQQLAEGSAPLRFSLFLEEEKRRRGFRSVAAGVSSS